MSNFHFCKIQSSKTRCDSYKRKTRLFLWWFLRHSNTKLDLNLFFEIEVDSFSKENHLNSIKATGAWNFILVIRIKTWKPEIKATLPDFLLNLTHTLF